MLFACAKGNKLAMTKNSLGPWEFPSTLDPHPNIFVGRGRDAYESGSHAKKCKAKTIY